MAIIHVGENTKVSALATQIVNEVRQTGGAGLRAVGDGAVNQAVKAVATAREVVESEGFSSVAVIIPQLADVPLGHGCQIVVHLTVMDVLDL